MLRCKYEEPIDIACFFRQGGVIGLCNIIIDQTKGVVGENRIDGINSKVKELGISPLIYNKERDFLQVDYGFVVYCFLKYIKMNFDEAGKGQVGDEYCEQIKRDFLIDDDRQMLSNNIKLFTDILRYFGLCYVDGKRRNRYTRILYRSKKTGEMFLLNSVILFGKKFKELMGNKVENLLQFATQDNFETIAFDRQIGSFVANNPLNDILSLSVFWNREIGLQSDFLKLG